MSSDSFNVTDIFQNIGNLASNFFSYVLFLNRSERHVHPNEIAVDDAPRGIPQHVLTAFVQSKSPWIQTGYVGNMMD